MLKTIFLVLIIFNTNLTLCDTTNSQIQATPHKDLINLYEKIDELINNEKYVECIQLINSEKNNCNDTKIIAMLLTFRGQCYYLSGNYSQAIKDCQKAQNYDSQYGESYYIEALAHFKCNNTTMAYSCLQIGKALGNLNAQKILLALNHEENERIYAIRKQGQEELLRLNKKEYEQDNEHSSSEKWNDLNQNLKNFSYGFIGPFIGVLIGGIISKKHPEETIINALFVGSVVGILTMLLNYQEQNPANISTIEQLKNKSC